MSKQFYDHFPSLAIQYTLVYRKSAFSARGYPSLGTKATVLVEGVENSTPS